MPSLFDAIEDGDRRRVEQIVRADPAAVDLVGGYDGHSPLMHAIHDMDRQFEIIEFLVASGANVNFATPEGYTALHSNVDVNGPSGSGEMPYRIARLLKQRDANVEARNHYGWTPLMRAALEGTADEFNALLQVGADFNVEYTNASMPVFTRGRSLACVVLPWPRKIEMLLAAGFRPQHSLIDQAMAALEEARDPQSIFSNGVRESIRIIERAI